MSYNLPVGAAVRCFHQLMGTPAPDAPPPPHREILTWDRWGLRLSLIDEEYEELHRAYEENDAAAFLDACVDMVYVVVGTAIEAGLPFDEAFEAVHRANMEKAVLCEPCQGTGKVQHIPVGASTAPVLSCETCAGKGRIVKFNDIGKVMKPKGWVAPDIEALVDALR